MAAEKGFTIEDEVLEIPSLSSFTIDEAQILWDFCQCGIEDFIPDGDDGEFSEERLTEVLGQMKNPAFRRTLMYVAYRRSHPTASKKAIEAAIGGVSNAEALAEWMKALDEGDARPPASTLEPSEPSPRNSVGSSESSGTASQNDSGGQVVPLSPTTDGNSPASESTPRMSVS